MSTSPTLEPNIASGDSLTGAAGARASFAICLPSMPSGDLATMIAMLRELFPAEPLLIVSPDQADEQPLGDSGGLVVPYPTQRTGSEWVLNAADYTAAARVATERGTNGVILLGAEANTLSPHTLLNLRQMLTSNVDLAVPHYRTGPEEGLVNSALLYPLTRALYAVDVRFPLPLDAALSPRMLTRLSHVANRAPGQTNDGLVWPVAEAAVSGLTVRQSEAGERALPRPQEADLNVLFPTVTSSLFADLETKATFWQRARTLPAGRQYVPSAPGLSAEAAEEIQSLVERFRLAFSNLREIWSLVLPPQTLLQLKKLSQTPAESFSFPPNLWARVVYDFAIAFHLRTLNRGHLLGALTPLYLAWVAGLLREGDGPGSEALLESTASAFEQEKPYLVSRWRWPDRFNP